MHDFKLVSNLSCVLAHVDQLWITLGSLWIALESLLMSSGLLWVALESLLMYSGKFTINSNIIRGRLLSSSFLTLRKLNSWKT